MLPPYIPRTHIPHVIDNDVVQSDVPEQRRDSCATRRFRARRCGYRGQLGLALERDGIGALDVGARRADAIVGKQSGDHARKL
jgi:hypothetical protein